MYSIIIAAPFTHVFIIVGDSIYPNIIVGNFMHSIFVSVTPVLILYVSTEYIYHNHRLSCPLRSLIFPHSLLCACPLKPSGQRVTYHPLVLCCCYLPYNLSGDIFSFLFGRFITETWRYAVDLL